MWRGWHKFTEEYFDAMASVPSTFPSISSAGAQPVVGPDGEPLFALVLDNLIGDDAMAHVLREAEGAGFEEAMMNTGDVSQEKGQLDTGSRQSRRAIFTSTSLAEELWTVLEPHMPPAEVVPGPRWRGWRAVGVNPRLRVLQYSETDRFEVHMDGSYSNRSQPPQAKARTEANKDDKDYDNDDNDDDNEEEEEELQKSFLTLQVYLNDGGGRDFTGGGTRFITPVGGGQKKRKSPEAAPEPEQFDATTAFDTCDVVPRRGRVLMFQHNIWHEGERITRGSKLVLRSEIMFAQRA